VGCRRSHDALSLSLSVTLFKSGREKNKSLKKHIEAAAAKTMTRPPGDIPVCVSLHLERPSLRAGSVCTGCLRPCCVRPVLFLTPSRKNRKHSPLQIPQIPQSLFFWRRHSERNALFLSPPALCSHWPSFVRITGGQNKLFVKRTPWKQPPPPGWH